MTELSKSMHSIVTSLNSDSGQATMGIVFHTELVFGVTQDF